MAHWRQLRLQYCSKWNTFSSYAVWVFRRMRQTLIGSASIGIALLILLALDPSRPTTADMATTAIENKPERTGDRVDRQPAVPPNGARGTSVKPNEKPATGIIEGVVIYEADPKRRWRYGRYYIKDRKKGFLAEAVVALRGPALKQKARDAAAGATWNVDQENFRFVPETCAIRAGDTVKFSNSDPETHNVNSTSGLDQFNVNIGNGQEHSQTFRHAGGIRRPVRLGCVLHSGMRCWIFVFAHPYYQLTKADGRFRLEDVPAGRYELAMAHPAGELSWSEKVDVTAGQTVRVEIRVSPDDIE